jgi:hypothetical protein
MTKAFPYTDIDIVPPRVCLEGNIALMQKRFSEIFNLTEIKAEGEIGFASLIDRFATIHIFKWFFANSR